MYTAGGPSSKISSPARRRPDDPECRVVRQFRWNNAGIATLVQPVTDGQGFPDHRVPEREELSCLVHLRHRAPPQDGDATLASPARWLTAQGPYSGGHATWPSM